MTLVNEITLPKSDDWHVHLRDGDLLHMALPWTARAFGRAIVMPKVRVFCPEGKARWRLLEPAD